MAVLLGLVGLGTASAAKRVKPSTFPGANAVLASNAYGDTAWFETATVFEGPPLVRPAVPDEDPSRFKQVTAWARTRGTPILVVSAAGDQRTAIAIVKDVLRSERLGLDRYASGDSTSCVESGRFDDFRGRPLHGWLRMWPISDRRHIRLIFAVIGLTGERIDTSQRHEPGEESWTATRSDATPLPLRSDILLRPFKIPVADRLQTARIIGDFEVDLGGKMVRLLR